LLLAIIDGHGGGIGSYIIKCLREDEQLHDLEIIALGLNSLATAAMMKARANRGASGENAVSCVASRVDIIIGSMSIVMANSMLGEVTPKMAEAVSDSRAIKLLLPLPMENVSVVGYEYEPLPHLTGRLIQKVREIVKDKENRKNHV
jgi:hypothetical protein